MEPTATISLASADYPDRLRRMPRPPPEIHVRGELPSGPMVALVGSRAASMDAVRRAHALAGTLARRGLVVVSGGALGVDAASHEGALDGGGLTVAILGSGLGQLYPSRNIPLFRRVARAGALLSCHPHDAPPRRAHFPQRNGLIAGLARVVVVLQAGRRSGALNTATWARDLRVPLLASPEGGPGCARLLGQGAGRVSSADDVMAALEGRSAACTRPRPNDPDHLRMLKLMGVGPASLDTLASRAGWSTARVALLLVQLELAGFVMEEGGRYRKL